MVRLSLQAPANYRFGDASPPAISPNGRKIVFEAVSAEGQRQLWLRPLDSLTAQPLAGTEAGSYPFWSPDNTFIGFFAAGKLKKMDTSGGPATTLADASNPRGGTWSQKGVIVFAPTPYRLMQIPAAGGGPQPATNFEGKAATRFPWFLPDGSHFLYLTRRTAGTQPTIQIGSLASPTEDRALSEAADSFAIYAKGYLLFMKGNTLVARPFDEKRLEFTGEPVPVAEPIQLVARNSTQLGEFSASANGDLVYQGGLGNLRLTWLDRAGKHLGTLGDAAPLNGVQFSPDYKTVGVQMRDAGGNVDVWLFDALRGLRTRFTSDLAYDNAPVWSPDGRAIVFRSNRRGPFDLYRKPADGSRNEELLYADNLFKVGPVFHRMASIWLILPKASQRLAPISGFYRNRWERRGSRNPIPSGAQNTTNPIRSSRRTVIGSRTTRTNRAGTRCMLRHSPVRPGSGRYRWREARRRGGGRMAKSYFISHWIAA